MFGIPQFLLLFVPLAIYFFVDLAVIAKYDKKRRDSDGLDLSLYNFITVIFPLLVIVQPVLFPYLSLRISAWWFITIQAFGFVLSVAGIVLMIWARLYFVKSMNPAANGKYYAEYAQAQENHPVVTTGPYAIVRHPIFLSFFMTTFGLMLTNPSVTTVPVFLHTVVEYIRLAKKEESLLLQKSPEYTAYMNKTPRFLPRIRT
ncbi:MAG: isoprenylcysteine carboxylmethyltransferase family protein [Chloroflexi bacterium]|nr:isoprenylcysteine carboxylmethyltransferase family protein [Chloroflexota bacterium]